MGYHNRIESKRLASLVTIRSRASELWFVNNKVLEDAVLGYVAKYVRNRSVKLYALSVEGNHVHHVAHYPEGNRADFTRDLHSTIANAVKRHTPEYTGGRLWGRRHSSEFLPGFEDIEEYFFYTVLQPVQDGLVRSLSEYPFYNCFHDAIYGVKRRFKVINWSAFNSAKRYDSAAHIRDYTEYIELQYTRLPGYEALSKTEYVKLMLEKLHVREQAIVAKRLSEGRGFLGRENLLKVRRGALPRSTKTSTRYSHRPRILSVCPKRRQQYRAWYFAVYSAYREASRCYRAGELTVNFPDGTYRPHLKAHPPDGEEGLRAFIQ